MLKQWRFKVCSLFALSDGEIITGNYLLSFRGGKARPKGMNIYKPSKRKYDFVDYTGRFKNMDLDFCDKTCILEMLGYIRFVESSNGKQSLT